MGFLSREQEDQEKKKDLEQADGQRERAEQQEREKKKKDADERAPSPAFEWQADVESFVEELMRLTDRLRRPLRESEFKRLASHFSAFTQGRRMAIANALYRLGLVHYTDALVANDYRRLHKAQDP
jgi:hypothetical protein